jgi:Holliday junction resolvase
MNSAFSEYVLYEPILRILLSRGFDARCEYECPGIPQPVKGDKKRLDFVAARQDLHLAIEVKWARSGKLNVESDVAKLRAVSTTYKFVMPLLIVFGRKSHLDKLVFKQASLRELGTPRYADLGQTRFGCRAYTLQ